LVDFVRTAFSHERGHKKRDRITKNLQILPFRVKAVEPEKKGGPYFLNSKVYKLLLLNILGRLFVFLAEWETDSIKQDYRRAQADNL
jgi:hypothetical protein